MNISLKKISKSAFIIFFSIFLTTFLSSCKKDSSNPTDGGNGGGGGGNYTATINGDGWTNKSVTISTSTSTFGVSSQITAVNMICSDDIKLLAYTPGGQTGTFNFGTAASASQAVGITLTTGSGATTKFYFAKENSGTVTISSYGSIGGKVNGSFSGTLVNATSQAEITISGSFSATRTPDVP
jgi:hypothetical protein